jgi:zinc transporter ZupT
MMQVYLSILLNWLLASFPHILAHLAGLIVSLVLLRRTRSRSAILALAAFGGLLLVDVGNLLLSLLGFLLFDLGTRDSMRVIQPVVSGTCCILDFVALVLLVVAFWQALSRKRTA